MPQRLVNRTIYVIAHNIRSLHNVGSIFRTADALGVSKVFLTGYTGNPPDPKITKVALGAEQFVLWEKHVSAVRLVKKLRQEIPELTVVALENNLKRPVVSLARFNPKFPLVLILGEETKGVPKKLLDLCDTLVEIPMKGKKESLNVSVAGGIALWELMK